MSLPEVSAKVYELADVIAEEAISSDDPTFRLDAFKALSTFFIGTSRLYGRKADEEESFEGRTFLELREGIRHGETPLVAMARRRAAGELRDRDRNGKFS